MADDPRVADVIKRTVVLELPGMHAVEVRREIPYGDGDGRADGRTFDLYVPPSDVPPSAGAPVVLFVFGFPHARFAQGLRQMGAYTSWGRLLAASGLAAVAYSYREPVADLAAVIRHLRAHGAGLGVDPSRMAVWSASGNVPTALHLLMTEPPDAFRCAALLYGYMLDVPPAAEQFGLGVPARGRSIDDMPRTLPLLVVRAGQDQTPLLNASLDHFAAAALARNLPITIANHPTGPHAFDLFDDSEASREHCRRIIAFLRYQLA
jgi:acetyl esterase/lipase